MEFEQFLFVGEGEGGFGLVKRDTVFVCRVDFGLNNIQLHHRISSVTYADEKFPTCGVGCLCQLLLPG